MDGPSSRRVDVADPLIRRAVKGSAPFRPGRTSQVPSCGVDRDRRLGGRGECPPFLPTAASAPTESWLAGVGERAALGSGVEGGERFLADVALGDQPFVVLLDQQAAG